MKEKNEVFQLLGFDPNWICVVYDMIIYNYNRPFAIDIFPNLDVDIVPADRLKKIVLNVRKIEELSLKHPVLFGVGSPRNKFPIYSDFSGFVEKKGYFNLISKSSIVSDSVIMGKGVMIDHQCVLSAQTFVGFGVSIKRGSKIGHHNSIGDFTDINPGVVTSGNVKIGRGCEIGTGAVIKNNVTIGDNTFIGMGSVVTKDIPANSIAFGNPCKVKKSNKLWSI